MKDTYPDSKSDLFAGFIERAVGLVRPHGYMAQVTMQSWMFLSSYERLRTRLQRDTSLVAMLHMDNMVMRIAFGTSATVWQIGGDPWRSGRYTFVELADLAGEVPRAWPPRNDRTAIAGGDGFFTVRQADFAAIPGSPIVYWLSEKMRAAFSAGVPLGDISKPLVGLRTGDNNRFMRHWWEVSSDRSAFACGSLQAAVGTGARWFPYNKGGAFRRWYGNHEFVVNWEQDGKEIEEGLAERYPYLVPAGKTLVRGQGRDRYFSPSVSWSKISSGAPSFRAYPPGFIFDVAGTSMFAQTQGDRDRLIAFANSQVAYEQLSAIAPTMNFEVGQVAGLPLVDDVRDETQVRVATLVEQAKADWDTFEESWNFTENPLIKTFQSTTHERPPRADSN